MIATWPTWVYVIEIIALVLALPFGWFLHWFLHR